MAVALTIDMASVLPTEQEEEESGELYSIQRFSSDMAAEGKPWYEALCTLHTLTIIIALHQLKHFILQSTWSV